MGTDTTWMGVQGLCTREFQAKFGGGHIFNAVTVTQFWVELTKDCVIRTLTLLCDEDFLDCICQAAVTFILDMKKLILESHEPNS
jgi:hypothetical protein